MLTLPCKLHLRNFTSPRILALWFADVSTGFQRMAPACHTPNGEPLSSAGLQALGSGAKEARIVLHTLNVLGDERLRRSHQVSFTVAPYANSILIEADTCNCCCDTLQVGCVTLNGGITQNDAVTQNAPVTQHCCVTQNGFGMQSGCGTQTSSTIFEAQNYQPHGSCACGAACFQSASKLHPPPPHLCISRAAKCFNGKKLALFHPSSVPPLHDGYRFTRVNVVWLDGMPR